jgi:hypothetical protein
VFQTIFVVWRTDIEEIRDLRWVQGIRYEAHDVRDEFTRCRAEKS